MKVARKAHHLRNALTAIGAMGVLAYGCIDRPVNDVKPTTQSGVSLELRNDSVDKVDLLLEVDNSNSMKDNQANIMQQFAPLIQTLVAPPCISTANMTPHTCDPNNPDDSPQYPPVKNLNVGIVSSDLGTPGSTVPGCVPGGGNGDDGLLNPIHFGPGIQQHEPTPGSSTAAPPNFRPASCTDPNQYPSFITFDSAMAAADANYTTNFITDFRCNAGLYINGCGLEQQLESINRAINPAEGGHDASDHMGNSDPNAGFLRDDALLAIVLLSDEEDGSVRPESQDVFNSASTNWSSADLNLRMYMYTPCGPQDPTYPLDRYINPSDPTAGWVGLKPGHPERVVFAAIAGVPLDTGTGGTVNWDGVLGTPGGTGPDDFCSRDTSALGNINTAEGPVSMQQANMDSNCATRTVPACRRQGSAYDMTHPPCQTTEQYFAWPSRRIVEVARRFDQAPLCNGAACNNGYVTSICSNDYSNAMQQIVKKIQSRLSAGCLPRVLQKTPSADNTTFTVQCVVREFVQADMESSCDMTPGRSDPVGAPNVQTINGVMYHVCDIAQVPTNASDGTPVDPMAPGWFYNEHPTGGMCHQEIKFLANGPQSGSITRLECIQSISGVDDAGM